MATIRSDLNAEVAQYGGALGWNSFMEPLTNVTRPAFEVALYIKDLSIPARKSKTTEIYTVETQDHRNDMPTTTALLFSAGPDVLQTQISGFLLTPTNKDTKGHFLSWNTPYGNYTYGECVSMYLQGDLNRSIRGAPQRVDPDYYITPQGQKYTKPIVAMWDTGQTVNPRKQTFTATLYLER